MLYLITNESVNAIGKNDITDKAEAGGDCAKVIER